MSELRELTNAESDIVSGGGFIIVAKPAPRQTAVIELVEELIVDILKLLEPQQPTRVMAQKYRGKAAGFTHGPAALLLPGSP
jgi:hypothetical protein